MGWAAGLLVEQVWGCADGNLLLQSSGAVASVHQNKWVLCVGLKTGDQFPPQIALHLHTLLVIQDLPEEGSQVNTDTQLSGRCDKRYFIIPVTTWAVTWVSGQWHDIWVKNPAWLGFGLHLQYVWTHTPTVRKKWCMTFVWLHCNK